METDKAFTQMIDYQKTFFDNSFNLITMFQSQSEKIINMAIDQNSWIPDDGKKVFSYWTDAYQKQISNYKEFMDTNFNKIKETMAGPKQKAKA